MRFKNPRYEYEELTFEDVFLFQQYSDIESRTQIDIKPNSPLSTTIPIISSNMNAVTGKRMVEKLARLWWLWVLPQDMDLQRMLDVIEYVHNADLRLDTPLTVYEDDNIRDALWIINKRSYQTVIMVDSQNKPICIFKEEDFKWLDEFTKLKDLQKTRKLITWEENVTDEEAFNIMEDNGISSLPIINKQGELIWVLSKNDSVRNDVYVPSLNKNWQLDLAIALSMNWYKNYIDKILKAGVNTIFLDTAHWFTKNALEAIDDIRSRYSDIILVSWNVMSWEWTEALIRAWANWVKVWIWPWAMCTTRMMTWVWRPQFTAVHESSVAARENGGFIIADWWIRYPRDVALSLAAWATHAMLWTVLAWMYESPWDIKSDEFWSYKENFWMASKKAVSWRTKKLSKFEQAKRKRFEEWISTSKIYNPQSLWDTIDRYRTWLESAMSYIWAHNPEEFYEKAVVWVQTQAWFKEWTPHGEIKK